MFNSILSIFGVKLVQLDSPSPYSGTIPPVRGANNLPLVDRHGNYIPTRKEMSKRKYPSAPPKPSACSSHLQGCGCPWCCKCHKKH